MRSTNATSPVSATEMAETLDEFFHLWRRLIPSAGVSLTAASTLGLLLRSGPLRLTALAELEAVSQPAMTGLVSRLHRAGLVLRGADPTDGRVVLVELTAEGRALIQGRRAGRAEAMDDLLDLLDPGELARLGAAIPVLRRLIDHADLGDQHTPDVRESR